MTNNDTPPVAAKSAAPLALWLVLLAAAGAFALTMGTRQTMGLFLSALNTSTALGIGSISLAFAFGQLWWGLTQPFAGAVADRIGTGRVILLGVALVALGTFITPYMTTTAGLIFAIGVLAAGGAGMAGPSVLMAATARLVPASKRGLASGIVNAGGSFGQFVMAPIAISLTAAVGWASAMQWLGVLVLLALPAVWVLKGNSNALAAQAAAASGQKALTAREAIAQALATPSYRYLAVGFLVCGFHVAFLATHLPGVIAACGLAPEVGGWALAVIGLFNIVGSLAMGWAVGRWRMKSLLSLLYATRGVAVLVFVAWRLVLRVTRGVPHAPAGTKPLLKLAGDAGHIALYALMIALPITGLLAFYGGLEDLGELHGEVLKSLPPQLPVSIVAFACSKKGR